MSFDATRDLDRKFSALAAHRSAFGVTDDMLADPQAAVRPMLEAFRAVLAREVFVLGATGVATPRWPLTDFFDGLDVPESQAHQAPSDDSNAFQSARA